MEFPENYESRPEVRAAMKLIRRAKKAKAFGPSGSWAGYRMRLWALFYPAKPYPGRSWSVPLEFQYAHHRVLAGWSKVDTVRQFRNQILATLKSNSFHTHPIFLRAVHSRCVSQTRTPDAQNRRRTTGGNTRCKSSQAATGREKRPEIRRTR